MPTQNTRTSEPFEVALGITSFGLRGVLIGPLVAAVPIVGYGMIREFNRQARNDEVALGGGVGLFCAMRHFVLRIGYRGLQFTL